MRAGVDEYTEPSARRHPGLRCQRRQKAPEPTARRALQCLAFDLGGRWLLARHASIDDFVADQEGAGGPHRIMHDKFFIIDGRGVWTGGLHLKLGHGRLQCQPRGGHRVGGDRAPYQVSSP